MGGVRGELNTADIGSISDCAGAVQLPLCQKQVLIRIFSFSIFFKEMFHIKRVSRSLISQLKHQKKKNVPLLWKKQLDSQHEGTHFM